MTWKKIAREVLPQHTGSTDYGSPRDVMMRKGSVTVVKTRGHTAWCSRGQSAYYGPQWTISLGQGYSSEKDLNDGYRRAGESKMTEQKWLACLPIIAKAMGLKVAQLPQKVPRGGTLVWQDG